MTEHDTPQPSLSKSKYTCGYQCLKRLWYQVHEPLVGEVDEVVLGGFEHGNEVGEVARHRFPGGRLIVSDDGSHERAVELTRTLMADLSIPVLYEAAFTFEGVRVRVDILERLPEGRWRLIEVKRTTEVKPHHWPDVAVQSWVLQGCGLDVAGTDLLFLNRDFVYDGEDTHLYLDQLFTSTTMDPALFPFLEEVPARLAQMRQVLGSKAAPDIVPGDQCASPHPCEFADRCHDPLPIDHISNLHRLSAKKREALEALGVDRIGDIPRGFVLTANQHRARRAAMSGQIVVESGLARELKALRYPLTYMDFETINYAIPWYRGNRPYSQVPFQYSVHIQDQPGAEIVHHEWLADSADDPREPFIVSLLECLGSTKGHIVVYNKGFESTILRELAECFPAYAWRIERVQSRLWDLLSIIRNYLYHPAFRGSYSLKAVLPALIPEMTYDGMEVGNGQAAMIAFAEMIDPGTAPERKVAIHSALLAYCGQDTFAMVRLVERVRELAVIPSELYNGTTNAGYN